MGDRPIRIASLVATAFATLMVFAAVARQGCAAPPAEIKRADPPTPVNQEAANTTVRPEILIGVVVEKRANEKSYEAWNSPSDPYYVLDLGDVTETYKEGDKTRQQTRRRHVTLRPSANVSTADLAALKGKRVELRGHHTEGEPYKPADPGEAFPVESELKTNPDGTTEVVSRPLNRGAGFVVEAIVSDAQPALPVSLNPPIVVMAYVPLDCGASQLLIKDKTGQQLYLFNKCFRRELFLSTKQCTDPPDMRCSVHITKGIPLQGSLVTALEQFAKAGHSEVQLEKVKKETEFTKLTEEEKILAGSLYFLAALKAVTETADTTSEPKRALGISFALMDGTKITGNTNIEQFSVETASGTVKVPIADLVSLTPGMTSRPKVEKRVATLIAALGSDSFAEREGAQRELTDMGPMLKLIVAEYAKDADAERQHRVAQILKDYETWVARHPEAPSSTTTPINRQDTIQTSSNKYVGRIAEKQFGLETAYGTFEFELGQLVQANRVQIVPANKAEKAMCPAAVKLRDGSYVKGQLGPSDIEVHGPYGKARIPLPLLQEVTVQDDGKSIDVILTCGDHLKGNIDWTGKLVLKTATGTRDIAPKEIAHIGVGAAALVPFEVATNSIGMKLSLIPAGEFLMGTLPDEESRLLNEQQHRVRITRPFFMGLYPVTQAEYEQIMGNNPSSFASTGSGKDKVAGQDTRRFPVEQVSWVEAQEFCRKLSQKEGQTYRLPTEAEWEYACRAGTSTPFHFGKQLHDNEANSRQLLGRTTTVGSYKPNAFGLYDMHGNVWEWCADWYGEDYYAHSPAEDPKGPDSGSQRVFRGGSWLNLHAVECRSAIRLYGEPAQRSHCLGFRVVREWRWYWPGPAESKSPSKEAQSEATNSRLTRSVLTLGETTTKRVVFNVQLRAGESVCVSFGENGTTISTSPNRDLVGQLIFETSRGGFEITGQFFRHVNPNAKDVKILNNIKEERGRFRVATYSEKGAKNIPILVFLGREGGREVEERKSVLEKSQNPSLEHEKAVTVGVRDAQVAASKSGDSSRAEGKGQGSQGTISGAEQAQRVAVEWMQKNYGKDSNVRTHPPYHARDMGDHWLVVASSIDGTGDGIIVRVDKNKGKVQLTTQE